METRIEKFPDDNTLELRAGWLTWSVADVVRCCIQVCHITGLGRKSLAHGGYFTSVYTAGGQRLVIGLGLDDVVRMVLGHFAPSED